MVHIGHIHHRDVGIRDVHILHVTVALHGRAGRTLRAGQAGTRPRLHRHQTRATLRSAVRLRKRPEPARTPAAQPPGPEPRPIRRRFPPSGHSEMERSPRAHLPPRSSPTGRSTPSVRCGRAPNAARPPSRNSDIAVIGSIAPLAVFVEVVIADGHRGIRSARIANAVLAVVAPAAPGVETVGGAGLPAVVGQRIGAAKVARSPESMWYSLPPPVASPSPVAR